MGFKQHISRTWQMIEQQVNDVPFRPHDEIFIVRNGVKSAVTSRQGQYLRPIYDQIREHVKKHLLNSSEGAFILGNYDVS